MGTPLDVFLNAIGLDAFVEEAREASLARQLTTLDLEDSAQEHPGRLPRYAFLFEAQGLAAYDRFVLDRSQVNASEVRRWFSTAFHCWRALATLTREEGISSAGREVVERELAGEAFPPEITIAVRLAVCGLLAERTAETRLELLRFEPWASTDESTWRNEVLGRVATAFILLVRKAGGWSDVDEALRQIELLRQLQKAYEESYLGRKDEAEAALAAVELVSVYHLAQVITDVGSYLRDGQGSVSQVNASIDRHRDRSQSALTAIRSPILGHTANLVWAGCRELVQNSLWTHMRGLGASLEQFANVLVDRGRPRPVLELWPSQQEALRQNLLNPYPRAVLVEMPTSAGKTLLAKFSIVQSKALNPEATVVYLVPTRALVNQVTLDLRADFAHLHWAVEQAVPAFELDPLEEKLLGSKTDILVATPEKLDLLLRRDHPVTQNLSLIVADEAHNLGDSTRGARLELLLGMIKRDRPGARFLLLSPFLPNGEEISRWLGDERTSAPIVVDWKPSNTVVGTVTGTGRQAGRTLDFETLPSAANYGIRAGLRIPLGSFVGGKNTKEGITSATVKAVRKRGSVLILCRGPRSAVTQAEELRAIVPVRPASDRVSAVANYLTSELGRDSQLTGCLKHGIAFHHSGLSQESRWLIEGLIRSGDVDVICGTTTLAQGVNFPITTVIVESLTKGDRQLTFEDFWNIAGRAGRALVDSVGVVAFPSRGDADRQAYELFLQDEARALSSQLAGLIDQADEIAANLGINAIFKWPVLGPFLQFLAHAMRVSGGEKIADQVEDLLRASLVFHQAQRFGPDAAQKLVRLCRAYLAKIKGEDYLLSLADQTGFSTPSVLQLQARLQSMPDELKDVGSWSPSRLFGDDPAPLTTRIEAIGQLPEMRLGPERGTSFNPRWIAEVLRDWTRGSTIDALAEKYMISDPKEEIDPDVRAAEFSKYLFGKLIGLASWGMGALESVSLSGRDTDSPEAIDAAYVPSMIFFGVQRKEAVWLRTVGVPRIVADSLGQMWAANRKTQPESYAELRNWVTGLTDAQWTSSVPDGSPLTARDLRLIWHEFTGAA